MHRRCRRSPTNTACRRNASVRLRARRSRPCAAKWQRCNNVFDRGGHLSAPALSQYVESARFRALFLQLYLRAELDDAVGGDIEEFARLGRVLGHGHKQSFAPERHTRSDRCDQRLARDKKRRVHHIERITAATALFKKRRNVRVLLEPKESLELLETAPELFNPQPFPKRDFRNIARGERQQHHTLVQHLVVLEVVKQRMRYPPRHAG